MSGLKREMRDLKEVVADLTLENRILLENYFLPGDLEAQVDAFNCLTQPRCARPSLSQAACL